jgi:hypothetical protein
MIQATLVKKLEPKYEFRYDGARVSCNSNRQLHSFDDHPAVIHKSGSRFWYKDGELHRDNDLPAIISATGYNQWWVDGKPIRREYT